MINHPAMPKIETDENLEDAFLIQHCRVYAAEFAFRSMVKWLEEHNQAVLTGFLPIGHLYISVRDWQSLRKAAGLEEK